jgi:hypothetical protein
VELKSETPIPLGETLRFRVNPAGHPPLRHRRATWRSDRARLFSEREERHAEDTETARASASRPCTAAAALANPYEDYEGTTLIVNFPAHPHYDAVMQILPEFTKETGIEVEVDQLPYLKMRERQTLELAQEEGEYDLIAYVVFSKADYVYADQLRTSPSTS